MAQYPDIVDLAVQKRRREFEKKRHLEKSIKKYGERLGNAFHLYIYDGDRLDFYKVIVQINENESIDEKVLALCAMNEADEYFVGKMIQRATSKINPIY